MPHCRVRGCDSLHGYVGVIRYGPAAVGVVMVGIVVAVGVAIVAMVTRLMDSSWVEVRGKVPTSNAGTPSTGWPHARGAFDRVLICGIGHVSGHASIRKVRQVVPWDLVQGMKPLPLPVEGVDALRGEGLRWEGCCYGDRMHRSLTMTLRGTLGKWLVMVAVMVIIWRGTVDM